MKRFLILLTLLCSTAYADGPGGFRYREWHHDHDHYRGGGMGWVGPAIIGGVIGYELGRPRYDVVPTPPVVVQQPPVVYNTLPPVPYGYHYQQMIDPYCNCYKFVLVPN